MPKRAIDSGPSPSTADQTPVLPPNKRRRLPVILDHTSFPHIFDAILDAVPFSDLLNLRLVSRNLCARADMRMAQHILVNTRRAAPTSVGRPTGRCASVTVAHAAEHAHLNTTGDCGTGLGSYLNDGGSDGHCLRTSVFAVDLAPSKSHLRPLPALRPRSPSDPPLSEWLSCRDPLKGVIAVDVIGTVPPQLGLGSLPLRVVRFPNATLGFSDCALHSETAVVFTRPEGDDYSLLSEGASHMLGLKRIVVNVTLPEPEPPDEDDNFFTKTDDRISDDTSDPGPVRYDGDVWCPIRWLNTDAPSPPTEVVFIFDPAWRHDLHADRIPHEMEILYPLTLGAATLLPDTRFVLVGLEAVPLVALNILPEDYDAKSDWLAHNYTGLLAQGDNDRLDFLAKVVLGGVKPRRSSLEVDVKWRLGQLCLPDDLPIDQVKLKWEQAAPDPHDEDKRLLDYKMATIRQRVCCYIKAMRDRFQHMLEHGLEDPDYPGHPYRPDTWPDERIEAMVQDGIVACTYDEYRARVGKDQWGMETVVYG